MKDVTRILCSIERGDPAAADELLPLVYGELRKLATARLAQERPNLTLQATALVHEAYVRLVDGEQTPSWNSRGHFFGAAAEAMRRILIEQAREKSRQKRGGDFQRVDVEVGDPHAFGPDTNVLAVDEALTKLALRHPEKVKLVKLRYFGGLTLHEAADALDISARTADRQWKYARAWLARELRGLKQN